jgi:cell division protein FtsB
LKDRRKLRVDPHLRQAHRVRPTVALLPFSLMVMAIMTVPTLVLDDQGLPRYRHLRAEVGELRESNQELVREIAQLKSEIDALRADPTYIERIARDELGMVRPEEFVFQFPPR